MLQVEGEPIELSIINEAQVGSLQECTNLFNPDSTTPLITSLEQKSRPYPEPSSSAININVMTSLDQSIINDDGGEDKSSSNEQESLALNMSQSKLLAAVRSDLKQHPEPMCEFNYGNSNSVSPKSSKLSKSKSELRCEAKKMKEQQKRELKRLIQLETENIEQERQYAGFFFPGLRGQLVEDDQAKNHELAARNDEEESSEEENEEQ